MDEYIYLWAQWGVLNGVSKIANGFKHYKLIKKRYGNLKNAWTKINAPFLTQLGFDAEKIDRVLKIRERIDFQQITQDLKRTGTYILFIEDSEYPECLKNIPNPPVFLFVRGKIPPLHKALAVVGTRKITKYGEMTTQKFVSGLVHNGFVIVSGMAIGVDACAHEATLENNGITVAVLGSGVDQLYPRENYYLGKKIIESGGAIVSEYPVGTQARKHHFPARNRIISGLSRGVLIVEGGESSGALITARCAIDQCREVFAVPSSLNGNNPSGANKIIRNSQAKLVQNVNHILEEFQMEPSEQDIVMDFTPIELELIEHIKNEGKSIDELIEKTNFNVAKLSEILITLHLKGVVREVGSEWVLA